MWSFLSTFPSLIHLLLDSLISKRFRPSKNFLIFRSSEKKWMPFELQFPKHILWKLSWIIYCTYFRQTFWYTTSSGFSIVEEIMNFVVISKSQARSLNNWVEVQLKYVLCNGSTHISPKSVNCFGGLRVLIKHTTLPRILLLRALCHRTGRRCGIHTANCQPSIHFYH